MDHIDINLARVSLRSTPGSTGEASLLRHELIELLDPIVVALEYGEEGGLRTRCTLGATKLAKQPVSCVLEIVKVVKEILNPDGSSLADSYHLCRLAVGVAKAGQAPVLNGKSAQSLNDRRQFWQE